MLNPTIKLGPYEIRGRRGAERPGFLAVGPDGALLVSRDQRSSQLYALKWRAP